MMISNVDRIILIGFRGAGKSTVAKTLAQKLGWRYISTDSEIEQSEGKSINGIVNEKGWEYFRKLEAEVLSRFHQSRYVVLDTGGGIVENEKIMEELMDASMVIWIDADTEDILERLRKDRDRPLLNQNDLIEDIRINYQRRIPFYQRYAHFRFNTSIESAEEICNEIIRLCQELSQ